MSFTNKTFSTAKQCFDKYNLIYLTWSKFENDWNSTFHFHPFTEIMYVVDGEGSLLLKNNRLSLSQGDIVIINPNISHTETSEKLNTLEYFIFAIDNISFNIFDKEDLPYNNEVFKVNIDNLDERKLLLSILKKIQHELTSLKIYYEVYAQSLINEVIIFIIRKTNIQDIETTNNTLSTECTFVKRYIDLHFSEKISLTNIAKKTFFSKYYLIHSFKKQLGIPPFQYLLNKRLNEAVKLLTTTNMSITSISNGVGFSSPSQFTKCFKEIYGDTPKNYRNQHKKKMDEVACAVLEDTI